MIITIDGPSGSGKTTLALSVARALHFFCMNSGYLYRGLGYILINYYQYDDVKFERINIADVQAIFESGQFRYEYDGYNTKIFWADHDITMFLKSPRISHVAGILGSHLQARSIIRQYEQALVLTRDSVVEGRACGSVIYPQAEIKFYVNADQQVRAHRLVQDQRKRGVVLAQDEALRQIQERDMLDQSRKIEPLMIPNGAIVLDSTDTTADQLEQKALEKIKDFFKLHKKNG